MHVAMELVVAMVDCLARALSDVFVPFKTETIPGT
jgi:hypothetical protein